MHSLALIVVRTYSSHWCEQHDRLSEMRAAQCVYEWVEVEFALVEKEKGSIYIDSAVHSIPTLSYCSVRTSYCIVFLFILWRVPANAWVAVLTVVAMSMKENTHTEINFRTIFEMLPYYIQIELVHGTIEGGKTSFLHFVCRCTHYNYTTTQDTCAKYACAFNVHSSVLFQSYIDAIEKCSIFLSEEDNITHRHI